MAYNVTAEDWKVVASRIKQCYIKIEVLAEDDKILGIMEGDLISGTMSIDAESSSRRTFNPVFFVRNKDYLPSPDAFVWFNRYVRVTLGIKVPILSDYKWYSLGKFLFNEDSYEYNADTRTVSVQLVDMMETLTGTLSGAIGGADKTIIPADGKTTIRNAMISTVEQLGSVNKYVISKIGSYSSDGDPTDEKVPYDLEFETGANVYDVVSKLRDLYSGYETFFDTDGTFICQQVPTGIGDPDVLSSEDIENYGLVISEHLTMNFADIKNVTEVWGKSLESDRYTEDSVLVDVLVSMKMTSRLIATFTNCTVLEDGLIYGIKMPTDVDRHGSSPQIWIIGDNNTKLYSGQIITLDNKTLPKNTLQPNTEYCFQFKNNKLYLLGQSQVHAITMLVSKEPTFAQKQAYNSKYNCSVSFVVDPNTSFGVDQIGIRLQVFSGAEYDDIYSDDLARQRAEYENWKSTGFKDTIDLNMIMIPWLDVNQKIRYLSKVTNTIGTYLVKKIDYSLTEGTMDISLMRFNGLYPFSN